MNDTVFVECPEVTEHTMRCLRQRLCLDADDTSRDKEILSMSGYRFLDECLKWEGIIGYTADIIDMIYEAFGIDLSEEPFDEEISRTIEE